eukprot:30831-Pelagococcus_subviridis.AAC.13
MSKWVSARGDAAHLVRRVGVDVGARGGDGAQLHDERVLLPLRSHLLVVPQRAAVPARAVPVLPSAADVPVAEVQPQVLDGAGVDATPAGLVRGDLPPLARLLRQRPRVLALAPLLAPRGDFRLVVEPRVPQHAVDGVQHDRREVVARERDEGLRRHDDERMMLRDVVLRGVLDVARLFVIEREVRLADAVVRGEVYVQPRRGQRRVVAVHALVLRSKRGGGGRESTRAPDLEEGGCGSERSIGSRSKSDATRSSDAHLVDLIVRAQGLRGHHRRAHGAQRRLVHRVEISEGGGRRRRVVSAAFGLRD